MGMFMDHETVAKDLEKALVEHLLTKYGHAVASVIFMPVYGIGIYRVRLRLSWFPEPTDYQCAEFEGNLPGLSKFLPDDDELRIIRKFWDEVYHGMIELMGKEPE